jgi:hypothetical protein
MGASAEMYDAFAERQRMLRRNTQLLGEELAESERTAVATIPLRKAVMSMGEAETQLTQRHADPATDAQDEALERLNEALARLEEVAQQTEEMMLRRSLDQIREDLEQVLQAQRAINTNIEKLQQSIEARGRIGRLEARSASKLARDQAAVRKMVETQTPDFEQVVVFQWALNRVAGWMNESRDRLVARKIDDELVATTDRIVRELEKLIAAIVETRSLPLDTEFVEAEHGGAGDGAVIYHKPVPTVAELLVLRAMQNDVNSRTAKLHGTSDRQNPGEAELRELRMLGEDQAEVKRLTEKLTKRARLP